MGPSGRFSCISNRSDVISNGLKLAAIVPCGASFRFENELANGKTAEEIE